MTWNTLLKEIRDNNRVLLHLQENGKYIPVRDESTEYVIDESCPLDEKWEWSCRHLNTTFDEVDTMYMTPDGVSDYATIVKVCEDCPAVYNGFTEEWDHE